jgi:hypothetical protein
VCIESETRIFLIFQCERSIEERVATIPGLHVGLGAFELKVQLFQVESVFPRVVHVKRLVLLHIRPGMSLDQRACDCPRVGRSIRLEES